MDWSERLIVRAVRVTGLWAIDTPFEPLLTGRARVAPAADEEIDADSLAALESHLLAWARAYRVWVVSGALGIALLSVVLALTDSWSTAGVLGVVCLVPAAFAGWLAWLVAIMLRFMKDPSYSLADRMVVALKRDTFGSTAKDALRSLRSESPLRLYLGSLLPSEDSST